MICVVDKQVCNRFVVGTYYTSGSGQEVRGVWEGEITFQGALATGKSYYITRTAQHTCCLHSKHLLCMCIRYTLATEAIASLHLALYANKPSISLTYGALTGVAKIGQEQIQHSYSNTTVEDFAVREVTDLYTYTSLQQYIGPHFSVFPRRKRGRVSEGHSSQWNQGARGANMLMLINISMQKTLRTVKCSSVRKNQDNLGILQKDHSHHEAGNQKDIPHSGTRGLEGLICQCLSTSHQPQTFSCIPSTYTSGPFLKHHSLKLKYMPPTVHVPQFMCIG